MEEVILPITNDAIEIARDTINEITERVNTMSVEAIIDIPSTIRVRLMETDVLGKYANNILALQEIILAAQRRIFENPSEGLNLFYALDCGIIMYDPIIAERVRYGDISWFGAYRVSKGEVLSACLEHIMQIGDYNMLLNRVFSGLTQSIFTSSALWYALKGGNNNDDNLQIDTNINLTVNLLANRSDYFYYPGAEEELTATYDNLLSKAVNIVTNDMRQVQDLFTTLSLAVIPDVTSIFSVYGDRNNTMGIDRVAVELAENVSYRITDALVQCVWDNLDYLVANEGNLPETRLLFDRIVKLYLEIVTLI